MPANIPAAAIYIPWLSTILSDILVTNEPARVNCYAPDYMLTRKGVPVGYIEAKDFGVDLNSKSLKEQFDRLQGRLISKFRTFAFSKNGIKLKKII